MNASPAGSCEAVILAGGKGTRLASRLNGLPKPLVEVGGVPLLARQLRICREAGIRRVLVLVNHRADVVEEFCRGLGDSGLEPALIDDGEPRGTAGAVLAALPHVRPGTRDLLVLYGDTLLNVDLARMHAFHREHGADATLLLHPNDHPYDSDLVDIDDAGKILGISPYPHKEEASYPNLVNAALYFVRRNALERYKGLAQGPPRVMDFAKNLFPLMLEQERPLQGYVSPEYIKDVGTPDRLDRAEADIASGRYAAATLSLPQKAVFLDRDGVINQEAGHISRPGDLRLLPGVGAAIRRLNQAGYLIPVITNQPVVARGECDEAGLKRVFNHMEMLLGRERAYVDRIYCCPHHPDKGFAGERADLKIACSCRKPETGLVERAVRDMNIDPGQSWFVGDRTADILCAARAGLTSILVSTGDAGNDGKHRVEPDFRAMDLPQAVSIILDSGP